MKTVLRTLRKNRHVNWLVRTLLRKLMMANDRILRKSMLYWHVAGQVTVNVSDTKIKLYSEGNDALTSKLYYGKRWEPAEFHLFGELTRRSRIIFDVGGNIGLYSLYAAVLNPNASIYCFEPNPINAERTEQNIRINGATNIKLMRFAVGSKSGKFVKFFKPRGNYVSDVSSFYKSHTSSFNDFEIDAIDVEVVSLDDFARRENVTPDVIKIDIELYEFEALKGMSTSMTGTRPPHIIAELFNDEVKRRLNPDLDREIPAELSQKIEDLLTDRGYVFYLISNNGLLRVSNIRSNPESSMYLLTPRELPRKFYTRSEFSDVAKCLLD